MADHNDLGNKGEDKAVAFLKSKDIGLLKETGLFMVTKLISLQKTASL